MKKILLLLTIIGFFLFLLPVLIHKINAAFFKFDQTAVSVAKGSTFQIAVTVDPGSDSLNSVDAYVAFDSAVLQATEVTAGSLFPTVSHDLSTAGKVYIAGLVNDPASSISTAGTLATITFQALKDGSVSLSFNCDTSKIIKDDVNASNVINCSQNGTATVTAGSGSGSSNNNPPAELPQSGIFDNVVKFAVPGAILFFLGIVAKLMLI